MADEEQLPDYKREAVGLAMQMKKARSAGQIDIYASLEAKFLKLKEIIVRLEQAEDKQAEDKQSKTGQE